MLTLYRRHFLKSKREPNGCPKQKDRYWRRCNCPMWVEGTLGSVYHRESLKTRSWERAKEIIEKWEAKPDQRPNRQSTVSLSDAGAQYVAHCQAANLSESTIRHRRQLLDRFTTWCAAHRCHTVDDVNLKLLRQWFAARENRMASTRGQERTELSLFFQFAVREKWIEDDPTTNIARVVVRQQPTEYLDRDEFNRLVDAITDPKLRALVLLLRWSGLRITDALKLERRRIDSSGLLMLYQSKTNTPVVVPLPPHVIRALKLLPNEGERFFDGPAEPQADWARSQLKSIAKRAGLKHIHPHQLRDTFAIELLLSGATLDQVSKALGHANVTVTERHYSPWVKARQDQLNETIRKAWTAGDEEWEAGGIELIETTRRPGAPERVP